MADRLETGEAAIIRWETPKGRVARVRGSVRGISSGYENGPELLLDTPRWHERFPGNPDSPWDTGVPMAWIRGFEKTA